MKRKKTINILTIIFLVIGIISVIISLEDVIKLSILKTHKLIDASIIEKDNKIYLYNSKVKYSFKINDYEYTTTDTLIGKVPEKYNMIKVLYNKDNPKESDIFQANYKGIIIGIVSVIISEVLLIKNRKKTDN